MQRPTYVLESRRSQLKACSSLWCPVWAVSGGWGICTGSQQMRSKWRRRLELVQRSRSKPAFFVFLLCHSGDHLPWSGSSIPRTIPNLVRCFSLKLAQSVNYYTNVWNNLTHRNRGNQSNNFRHENKGKTIFHKRGFLLDKAVSYRWMWSQFSKQYTCIIELNS